MAKTFIITAYIFGALVAAQSPGPPRAPTGLRLVPEISVTQEEADAYMRDVIYPILVKHRDDPGELPALKRELRNFYARSKSGGSVPVYTMKTSFDGHMDMYFKYATDKTTGRISLFEFVPPIKLLQSRIQPAAFSDYIAAIYAGEMLLWEEAYSGKPVQERMGQAKGMARFVLEIVRPLQAKGRLQEPGLVRYSEALRRAGDNPTSPIWLDFFDR